MNIPWKLVDASMDVNLFRSEFTSMEDGGSYHESRSASMEVSGSFHGSRWKILSK